MTMSDMEKRLQSALKDPRTGNQDCSECDRPNNTPNWAAFLVCPVDQQLLGVVCCNKCYKLFSKVKDEDTNFAMKSLQRLNDWTEDDMEALEISGNTMVNACFEASVTKEKEGRDRRKYGYEAFFFEKYVNLSFFDDVLYAKMIVQSTKTLVEKRFNESLRGFNLKKQGSSRTLVMEDEDGYEDNSNNKEEKVELTHRNASTGNMRDRRQDMRKSISARSIRTNPRILNRRRLSSRDLMADDDEENSETPLRRRLSSRDLMAGNTSMSSLPEGSMMSEKKDNNNHDGRRGAFGNKKAPSMVTVISGENIDSLCSQQRPNSRKSSAHDENRETGNGDLLRRASSVRNMGQEDSRGTSGPPSMRRAASVRNIGREDRRHGVRRVSSSRNILRPQDDRGSGLRRASSSRDVQKEGGRTSRGNRNDGENDETKRKTEDRRSAMHKQSSSRSSGGRRGHDGDETKHKTEDRRAMQKQRSRRHQTTAP